MSFLVEIVVPVEEFGSIIHCFSEHTMMSESIAEILRKVVFSYTLFFFCCLTLLSSYLICTIECGGGWIYRLNKLDFLSETKLIHRYMVG